MIRFNIDQLKAANRVLRSVVKLKGEDDLLANILIEARKDSVSILGTDMILYANPIVKAECEKPLKILIPFSKLSQFIELWVTDPILTKKGNQVIITCDGDELKLPLKQDLEEFIERFEPLDLKHQQGIVVYDLPRKISVASVVTKPDDIQMEAVQGIHISNKQNVFTVEATDRLRLISFQSRSAIKNRTDFDCIIHHTAGQFFSTLSDDGSTIIWRDHRYFYYNCELGTFAVLLINADNFPDLSRMIPKKKAQVTFLKSDLDTLVKKVRIIESDRVTLTKRQASAVLAQSISDLYEHEGLLEVMVKGKMPKLQIDINHLAYLLQNVPHKEVVLFFGDGNEPFWYNRDGLLYSGMPYTL